MASSRPDYLPAWATTSFALAVSGQQNKVRPPTGWRTNGWDENEEPPCNYENWMKNRIYQWLEFFDNTVIRSATALVVANDASDFMKDVGTAEGASVGKWLCDGTDDDVQIQAAIDAVEAAGGGLVLLSEGIFSLGSGLSIDVDGMVLAGLGRGNTTLKIEDSAASMDVITLSGAENCVVRDLSIDGNDANQGSVTFHGIVANGCTHLVIRDVSVHDVDGNSVGKGIQIKGGTSANCIVSQCRVYNCTNIIADIEITAGAGAVVERCRVSDGIKVTAADTKVINNTVLGGAIAVEAGGTDSLVQGNMVTTGDYGVEVSAVNGVEVSSNRIGGVTKDGIIVLNTCRDLMIFGNHITGCGYNGIEATLMSDSTVMGNHIDSCSQGADNTHDGIAIESGAQNSIVGNTIRTKGSSPDHQRGIYVASGAGKQWIVGNDLYLSVKNPGTWQEIADPGGNAVFPLNSGGYPGSEPFQVYDAVAPGYTAATVHMFNRIA